MQFHRLRLSGFKSFVEPTELYIEPRLTAIVGPNGCGKSNLIEALRWVMGENSPKSMRGSGMEDVIFAGTAHRPARNLADVTLLLDNSARRAPAAFNNSDQIEVSRRIERESGSAYRINGREVRARDVQLLFADAATGPHAASMVSQGRIGALINAKPQGRRLILEEAAGIMGLHSRRHEAELRLRAAETNLERLDDIMTEIEVQLTGLKRQARQAARYRTLSGRLRRAEALLLYLRWRQAKARLADVHGQRAEAEETVEAWTRRAAQASTAQTDLATRLPSLRQREAEAAAALHRLAAARDNLDLEERRAREASQNLNDRLTHLEQDQTREQAMVEDALANIARLDDERGGLESRDPGRLEDRERATKALRIAEERAAEAENALDRLNERAASAEARRASLEREIGETTRRNQRLEDELETTRAEITKLETAAADGDDPDAMAAEVERARAMVTQAEAAFEASDRQRQSTSSGEADARRCLQDAEGQAARLNAEASALAELLASGSGEDYPPVIDSITAEPGYEAALGAALGDDLGTTLDVQAPIHWHGADRQADDPPLPESAEPLANRIEAPPALARRLAQIGIVPATQGPRLSQQLKPGQRLVSRDGDLWRWDGYVASAGAISAGAVRLKQRNRLEELWRQLGEADNAINQARDAYEQARGAMQSAVTRELELRQGWREAEKRLADARERRAMAEKASAGRISRLIALRHQAERLARDLDETGKQIAAARTAHDELPPIGETRTAVAAQRDQVAALRAALAQARATFDTLERQDSARRERLEAIAGERDAWARRADGAHGQLEKLAERAEAARAEIERIAGRPAEIETLRTSLIDKIDEAERQRGEAADALAEAENALATRDRELREVQAKLAEARENRVRLQAILDQAMDRKREIEERIEEDLGCTPEVTAEIAEITGKDIGELVEIETAHARLERLRRERENMGPVNLRAEVEATELGERLATMESEKADLEAAIHRLRHAIGSLNHEGRERLLAAFDQVNQHFTDLFQDLFGGGRAYLKLTEAEDPLEAGLEIMAQPPGKKLQTLSLLSGGEQALAALSLIFAVFLTNPAPICVLDEVDAPLDDANVERLCTLMSRITETTGTRFLIVTHHPITMARVDRLFGVTMAERGVSQLVSVDLGGTEQLLAVG